MYKNASKNSQRRRDNNPSSGVFKPSKKKARKRTLVPSPEERAWKRSPTEDDRAWLRASDKPKQRPKDK